MSLDDLAAEVVACRRCPRLVGWRERVARDKRAAFRSETYWGKPVPGFGDPRARVVFVGLAPAAHGANRTGRMFTGDRSGEWLYAALHRAGFSDRPSSERADDGLVLRDAFITAAVRCAPPGNTPTAQERDACQPYLVRELGLLVRARVLVALGSFGWDACLRTMRELGHILAPKPRFGHGAEAEVGRYRLLGSYHPSQQNTFTGRLTVDMLDDVVRRAARLAGP